MKGSANHPPRPELSLTLGFTGHRMLEVDATTTLAGALEVLFARVELKVAEIGRRHAAVFGDDPPHLTLVSSLAEGADQVAAEVALAHGHRLNAVLPFSRDAYALDFAGPALETFEALLTRASAVWPLPSPRSEDPRGYVLAGEAIIAHCDILIAAWDGEDARGPGGTAEVVHDAIRRGVPVIHLPTSPGAEPAIVWAGFEEMAPERLRRDDAPREPLDGTALESLLDSLLAPPEPETVIDAFLDERERRLRARPEWALLLALTGVQGLKSSSFRAARYAEAARADWEAYLIGAAAACGPAADMQTLESAFAWADGLAQHYATVYRSGVVLNFAGAGLAVLLSLVAGQLPEQKLPLLLGELLAIGAVVTNTVLGTRREWHRRWLDYRFLAEQLRPLRSLRLLAAASPPVRYRVGPGRWTDWYAMAIWRAMGPPPGITGQEALGRLARHIASHELDGQVAYHRAAAHRMHTLDHRLHQLGMALFTLTVLTGLATLGALLFAHHALGSVIPFLGMLSAALPTLGAAIFGIRGAGDFAAVAGRSAETARSLARSAERLRRDSIDGTAAARAVEAAAATMLDDLGAWRATYSHRKLAIPS